MLAFSAAGLPDDAGQAARLIYESDPPYYDFWFGSIDAALSCLDKLWRLPEGSYSHQSCQVWRKDAKVMALACHYPVAAETALALTDARVQGQLRGDLAQLQQRDALLAWLFPRVPDDVWYLRTLAVDASLRQMGTGAQILAVIVSAARAHGARALQTDVDSANHGAVRFYTRHGFEIIAETRVPALEAYHLPVSLRMSRPID